MQTEDKRHVWRIYGDNRCCVNCMATKLYGGDNECPYWYNVEQDLLLGDYNDCTRCQSPDGMWRYDPFDEDVNEQLTLTCICDDCNEELCDEI